MQPDDIRSEFKNIISQCKTFDDLEGARVHLLGKKSALLNLFRSIQWLQIDEKKKLGRELNLLKNEIEFLLESTRSKLDSEARDKALSEKIDVSLPGVKYELGSIHPISQTAFEILDILDTLGFESVHGPEIEHDFYNFESLNISQNHPAREMQDTFYIAPNIVLRTQTSPVQIRAMLALKNPPFRIACFGKVYRRDQDITHSPMFHQIEVLHVNKNISFSDLKGTVTLIMKRLFSNKVQIRLRSSFFPFTEPSAEVDISCIFCNQSGCRLCGETGWIEILGCGLVHPKVLKRININPETYTGFAIGIGVERIAMLRFQIPDIRLFFENDLRFLSQF